MSNIFQEAVIKLDGAGEMGLNVKPEPSPLVQIITSALGTEKSGLFHGPHQCETPLDRLFSRLAASYNTFDNKFLRAELAEKILISCLMEESDLFRSGSDEGQADMEWFDGDRWNPVSIKYKGPNKSGAPPYSSQLSALAWSKNASGSAPTGLTCDMLIIWDADYEPNLKPPSRGMGKANFRRGLVIVTPEQFNPYYTPVESEKQNKTNSAFRIAVCRPALENGFNWVRNHNGNKIRRVADESLRITFEVK